MSITYPEPQKANPSLKPLIGPTPELRAKAAIDEAIGHFCSVARSVGMIGIFGVMLMSSMVQTERDWVGWLLLAGGIFSAALVLGRPGFGHAPKRARYFSGLGQKGQSINAFEWLYWVALIGATVGGLGVLIWQKDMGLARADAVVLSSWLFIVGQLVVILMETIQGIKLLRFAQGQTLSEKLADQ